MVIREALKYGIEQLGGVQTPVLDTQLFMCHVMKMDKLKLLISGDMPLNSREKEAFIKLVMRRAEGEPVAYILGECEFMSLDFYVTKAVLIPRPDTETLVEAVLERFPKGKLLEIGSGSGCIPISIAHYNKNISCMSMDISADATAVAIGNAQRNGVADRAQFITASVFDGIDGIYDCIVSNPPYIESDVVPTLQTEVLKEPVLALDGGDDGLDFYRYIISNAPSHLTKGGLLAFEIGYNQGQRVSDLMKDDFERIEILKDLAGLDRVVLGYAKG
ncbi:MAG: peptide chain release factor N(5)-glutamine methyltransferase [Eubacteriales bacterium]|nr:peptide chain release factor N(5)-glutamine methyltransferase [Eubacteriales bacterium]